MRHLCEWRHTDGCGRCCVGCTCTCTCLNSCARTLNGRMCRSQVVAVIYLDAFTTDASHLDLLAKSNPSAAASAAASTSNSSSITTSTNTSTISSISDSTSSGSSGSSLAAAGLAAEVGGAGAALQALSDLGYRYSITNALGGLVAASAQLPSAARGAAVEAPMELPGTQVSARLLA